MSRASSKTEYTPLFVRMFRPKAFALIIIGGLIALSISLLSTYTSGSDLELFLGILEVSVFLSGGFFVRFQANKLLVKKINETLSTKSKITKQLLTPKDFKDFIEKARNLIYNKNEIILIIVLAVIILSSSAVLRDVILNGSFLTLRGVDVAFSSIYWSILMLIITGSMIWSIGGLVVFYLKISEKEKSMKIYVPIKELEKNLSAVKLTNKGNISFKSLDLSFAELREALNPIRKIGQEISINIAVIGLIYSLPAIIYFFVTHNLPIYYGFTNYDYIGFCVFFAVLSGIVFAASELGTRKVWNNFRDQTIIALEKLSDRMKFQCVQSICKLEDYESRDNYMKDAAFVKSAIIDLKERRSSDTIKTAGTVVATLVFTYTPIILKMAQLY